MKVTGILFDKDDTLVNLADFWRTPIRRTCCCLARRLAGRENLQLTEQLCRAAGFQDGRLLEESLVVAGTNRDIVEAWKRVAQEHGFLLDEKLAESAACFLERSCQQDSLVIPTEEALPKLFVQLKKRGLVLGVVTSDNYAPTLHALEKLGLCSFFSAIYSADRLQRPKPDPEAAQQFCEKYHLPPPTGCNGGRFGKRYALCPKQRGIGDILSAQRGRKIAGRCPVADSVAAGIIDPGVKRKKAKQFGAPFGWYYAV